MTPLAKISRKLRALFAEYCFGSFDDVIFRKALDQPAPAIKDEQLSVVAADRKTMDDFLSAHAELRSFRPRAASYFDNNYKALLVISKGEPVGYVWWTDAQVGTEECQHPHVLRYDIDMGEGDVWGFDMHVLMERRGESTSSDFFGLFRRYLYEQGYTVLWGAAQKDNRPALWLHRMQRFDEAMTVHSFELFGQLLYVYLNGGSWYLKNGRFSKQKFDYRCIYAANKQHNAALKNTRI